MEQEEESSLGLPSLMAFGLPSRGLPPRGRGRPKPGPNGFPRSPAARPPPAHLMSTGPLLRGMSPGPRPVPPPRAALRGVRPGGHRPVPRPLLASAGLRPGAPRPGLRPGAPRPVPGRWLHLPVRDSAFPAARRPVHVPSPPAALRPEHAPSHRCWAHLSERDRALLVSPRPISKCSPTFLSTCLRRHLSLASNRRLAVQTLIRS